MNMGNNQQITTAKSGMAIAGFVLGIIALLTSLVPIVNNFSFFLAILGIIFTIVGLIGIMWSTCISSIAKRFLQYGQTPPWRS